MSKRSGGRVVDEDIQQDLKVKGRLTNGGEVCQCQFLRTRDMCRVVITTDE